jgi:hypothetical protein
MLQLGADLLKLLAARVLRLQERPAMAVDEHTVALFERVLAAGVISPTRDISCDTLPYPKYEFLRYVSEQRGLLLHGANGDPRIRLDPRPQTTFWGRPTLAVFATPDDIWSIFFAIVNNEGFIGSKRNGCMRIRLGGRLRKFYWFSRSAAMRDREGALCDGTVHLLPGSPFRLVTFQTSGSALNRSSRSRRSG